MKKLKLNSILVPYDFSKTAQIAVKQAAFIAAYSKSDLILVHILILVLILVHIKNIFSHIISCIYTFIIINMLY